MKKVPMKRQATLICPHKDGPKARLNDGSHRVIKLVMGSSSATSGDIQINEELTHVGDIKVSNLPTELIEILLSGPLDANVRLYLISLDQIQARETYTPP